ncbi:hypothetical protein [Natronorubrum sp. A-ect3]|uniref:hypothetical protein n=1 Tax=Natronorubrum sp. A-ect3 TaxID=3242698 RepID=UPI00359CDFA1
MKKTESLDTSRRSVLKAVGASAVVGSLGLGATGTVGAQASCENYSSGVPGQCPDPCEGGEELEGTRLEAGRDFPEETFCQTVQVPQEADTVVIKAGLECYRCSATGGQTQEFCVPEGQAQPAISNIQFWVCGNGNGDEDDPNFGRGCSQVCGVSDVNNVNVVYNEGNADGEPECAPADPNVALQPSSRAGEENCWEIVSDDYKIIGASGEVNTNRCAAVCYRE